MKIKKGMALFFSAGLAVSLLTGCQDGGGTKEVTPTAKAGPVSDPTPADYISDPTLTDWPDSPYDGPNVNTEPPGFVITEDEMMRLLEGDWEQQEAENFIMDITKERNILHFDTDTSIVTYRNSDGAEAEFSFLLYPLYEEDFGGAYRIRFDCLNLDAELFDGAEKFSDKSMDYQLWIVNDKGTDRILFAQYGGGWPFLNENVFGKENLLGTDWMFSRSHDQPDGDARINGSAGEEEDLRVCGETFYALKWSELGDSCTLQRVELLRSDIWVMSDMKEESYAWRPWNWDYALTSVNYKYEGREALAHSGFYDPALMEVTTNEKGEIVSIERRGHEQTGHYSWYGNPE